LFLRNFFNQRCIYRAHRLLREEKMSIKSTLLGTLILVLFVAGFLSVPKAQTLDRPPGISVDLWIPLSKNSGVVLTGDERYVRGTQRVTHGILFVKQADIWQKVYLDPMPGGVQLLKFR
jgi:hypothetical protein